MSKPKTNALDALRALIAERQQYEQWLSTLESKRNGTAAHVFEKVSADYESRLDRVVSEIGGHAEELQLNISTLSSRLIEVAREEDTRRDTLQEAELRAAVGEYEPAQWEEMRIESQKELDRIAVDRERVDNELGELRSIQTLGAVGARQPRRENASADGGGLREPALGSEIAPVSGDSDISEKSWEAASGSTASNGDAKSHGRDERASAEASHRDTPGMSLPRGESNRVEASRVDANRADGARGELTRPDIRVMKSDAAADNSRQPAVTATPTAVATPPAPARTVDAAPLPSEVAATQSADILARPTLVKSPPSRPASGKPAKGGEARSDQSKTLKCPECGTPNHPTEWYCERCGGELATM